MQHAPAINPSQPLWQRVLLLSFPQPLARRWYWPSLVVLLLFALWFPFQIFSTLHLGAYLGPGLGDPVGWQPLQALLQTAAASSESAAWALRAALLLLGAWMAAITFLALALYRRLLGQELPLHEVWKFLLLNAVLMLNLVLSLALLALVLHGLGWSWSDGYHGVESTALCLNAWVVTHVPTLLPLPRVLAFALVYTLAGFCHYWLHRAGHQLRAGWLLFHRTHHMPTLLSHPTTPPVFAAFPLFIVAFVPYALIFGAISKLFYAQPLYSEFIIFNMIAWVGGVFGHQTAFYDWAYKNRFFYALSAFYGNGVHHYVHHAREAQYRLHGTNMVNIGGGFFYMWDRVFKTYILPPAQRPEVGLDDLAPLHASSVRLAYAGVLQLAYELWHNKGWKVRLKILLGRSDWAPPISKDFALA